MTIPSEKELKDFVDWSLSSGLRVLGETRRRMWRSNDVTPTPEEGKAFLQQYLSELQIVSQRLRADPVMQWMTHQPGFVKAAHLAQQAKQGKNEILVERRYAASLELIEPEFLSRLSGGGGVLWALMALEHDFKVDHEDWPVCVLRILAEYMHSDHDSYFVGKSRLVENCDRIEQLILEIAPYIDAESRRIVGKPRQVLKFVSRWRELASNKKARNQKNKAELVFVKRMAILNMRFFSVPKPEVIAELMTLDCFRQQIGLRQISRLCAEHAANQATASSQRVGQQQRQKAP